MIALSWSMGRMRSVMCARPGLGGGGFVGCRAVLFLE